MAEGQVLRAWPPQFSEEQLAALTRSATDYALAHSIVYRPPIHAAGREPSTSLRQPPLDATIHAPISLLPTPFPRVLYVQSQQLQPLYNDLYARVTLNDAFLERVVGGNVVLVDEFQARLWQLYKTVKEEGAVQPLHLGLFRSDYLLHTATDGSLSIKQVELNTISSSFGPLCSRVSDMHRFLAQTTAYYGASPSLVRENLPVNEALRTMAAGLAAGHRTYLERAAGTAAGEDGASPVLLFVVQEGERNAFDQRLIEYELAETHGITVRRASLTQLATAAKLEGPGRHLFVTNPASLVAEQVSVVYFRAGYTPSDYTTEQAWDTRLLLERSLAIKCPTIALQLAGAKKVQQVLSDPGVVESLVQHPALSATLATGNAAASSSEYAWTSSDVAALRQSFMPMFGMEEGGQGVAIASDLARAKDYVLKPQREGGGNNVYREDIVPELQKLDALDAEHGPQEAVTSAATTSQGKKLAIKRREGYILMRLIEPPQNIGNYLVRYSGVQQDSPSGQEPASLAPHVISELGAFGTVLFESDPASSGALHMIHNHSGGHLLRTKAAESNEGGVAAGFSVIDSPLLV